MTHRLFGTDGIRGKAGEEPLTESTLARLGRILATRLVASAGKAGMPRVVLGHDGRESGEPLAAAIANGLTEGGANVDVLGLAPTPAVAFLAREDGYHAGVVVSASHNPAGDNGVKLLGSDGFKLADDDEVAVESALLSTDEFEKAGKAGEMRRTKRLTSDFIGWMRSEAFPGLDLAGWRILMDCANGAYSELGPRILKAFGAEVEAIHDRPDGRNINAGCGALHPEDAVSESQSGRFDIALVVDGDGDRGMLVDDNGRLLDGDIVLAGMGRHMHERGQLPGNTVVATVMSNMGLERYLRDAGVRVERVAVGDRHVLAGMLAGGFQLGGEKSGHILFGESHAYRGDGLYTFLRVVQAMQERGIRPSDFAAEYTEMPQELINLRVSRRAPLDDLPELSRAVGEVQSSLGDRGRAVVRFSGTELLLRLMVEAETHELIETALTRLKEAARAEGILAD